MFWRIRPLVLVKDNPEHFTAHVLAQGDECNIVRESWSLPKSRGDIMAWGEGPVPQGGQPGIHCCQCLQLWKPFWSFRWMWESGNILADPLRTLKANWVTQALNLKCNRSVNGNVCPSPESIAAESCSSTTSLATPVRKEWAHRNKVDAR